MENKRPTTTVKGIRTHHRTGEEREVELSVTIERYDTFLAVHLHGGPTGYESMDISRLMEWHASGKDWDACFGTGGWDKLVIPHSQAEKLLKFTKYWRD